MARIADWFSRGMMVMLLVLSASCKDDNDNGENDMDAGTETETDTGTETEMDTGTETEMDTGTETEMDTGTETEMDTGTETEMDTSSDTGMDTGGDTDMDAGGDTETEMDGGMDTETETSEDHPLDPATAPHALVDRFSEQAGTLFVRNETNGFPAAGEPIDFDEAPFITRGLGPDGQSIQYYNFDVMPETPAPIYVIVREGETAPVEGQLNVVGVIPGDDGYNDFWRVMRVTVPPAYVANTLTSVEEIDAGGYSVQETDTLVNCPIVTEGSTAELRGDGTDPGLTMGWYDSQVVFYFNFLEGDVMLTSDGQAPLSPIYVTFNINPEEPGGGPPSGFMSETGSDQTHNVASTLPDDPDYSPLWDVNIYDNADFDTVGDLASAVDATILAPGAATVNCPVVSIAGTEEPEVTVSDQTLEDLATVVMIDSTTSVGPGWMVIHEDDGGSPGNVLGYASVADGTTQDLFVVLNRPAVDGETLYAMLHIDEGTVGAYEFPGPDAPAKDAMDNIVTPSFTVTVPAETPAVRITIDNVGASDYQVVAAEPEAYAQDAGAGENDPEITLYTGWRYEIVNQASDNHPFELIEAGASPSADAVALSQSAAGSLEDNADINWFDDGDMTIRFTVTTDLTNAVDGYRCSIHISSMRGAITYE